MLKSPAANASFAWSKRLAPVDVLASEDAAVVPAEPDADEVADGDVRVVTSTLGDVDDESALLPHAVTATAPSAASTTSLPVLCLISTYLPVNATACAPSSAAAR